MTETLILDVQVRGVGRLKKATGTTRPAIRSKMKGMIHELVEDGRLDLLEAVRDNKLTLMQLYAAWKSKSLHKLPTAGAALPLSETWKAWVADKDCSAEHKRSLLKGLGYLDASERQTVNDLPALLEAARVRLKGKPQTFRLLRAGVQAFVKAKLKRSHPLYADVSAVEPMKPAPKKLKHPATVAELRAIGHRLGNMNFRAEEMLWALATTGMRPNEYWGEWWTTLEGHAIQGTKTKGARRMVPCVSPARHPDCSYTVFRKLLNKASDSQMSVYDLRRTYATWLEAAGIPRTRRRLYMGHGNSDVTDLYEAVEVKAFLAEDAAKLRAFIGEGNQGLRIAK